MSNRLFEIKGFKTTCLSKYRKVKLNNGLLTIRDREKLPNGMYKMVYICPFRKEGYDQCVVDYLKELQKNDLSEKEEETDEQKE